MAKKFKVNCHYQVKPEAYNRFIFDGPFWSDKPKDTVFLVEHVVPENGDAKSGSHFVAHRDERELCKRIQLREGTEMTCRISIVTANRVIVDMMDETNDFVGYVTIPKLESPYIWIVGLQAQDDEPEELIERLLAKAEIPSATLTASDLRVEHIHSQRHDLDLIKMNGLHKWQAAVDFSDLFLEDCDLLLAAWVTRLQDDNRWIEPPSKEDFDAFRESKLGPYDSFEDFMRRYFEDNAPNALKFFNYLDLENYWDAELAEDWLGFDRCYYQLT